MTWWLTDKETRPIIGQHFVKAPSISARRQAIFARATGLASALNFPPVPNGMNFRGGGSIANLQQRISWLAEFSC